MNWEKDLSAIVGYDAVVRAAGCQSVFLDAEIVSLCFKLQDDDPTVTMSADIAVVTLHEGSQGRALVHMTFKGVEETGLDDFNHQNVINGIYLEKIGERLRLHFNGIHGADLKFTCARVT